MVSLDKEDILAIDPAEVRVRLAISDPVELQTKNVRLVLEFEHKDGTLSEYQYLLEIIDVNISNAISSWFSSTPLKHVYQFKLATLSQLEFNKYQMNHVKLGKPVKFHWSVFYSLKRNSLKNKPADTKQIGVKTNELEQGNIKQAKIKQATIDMELKLSEDDGYFYLLKNATIEIN